MMRVLLCLCAGSALALSPQQTTRRTLLGGAVGSAAALVATPQAAFAEKARAGAASPFTGEFNDPQHPGCLRSVKVVGPKLGPDGRRGRNPVAVVSGVDGSRALF